ncbi:NADP-dependent oxidoreductase domain-containing protein [Pelagophyceae sp. CCMP2097]|nr:NADP-dependent oxidoreductase domain-containing protein [Pelagophyceae sp. CCMP2097]
MFAVGCALLAAAAAAQDLRPCGRGGAERCFRLEAPEAAGDVLLPAVALGTWSGSYGACAKADYACVRASALDAVETWVNDLNATHVDSANDYRTQVEVGRAIRNVDRSSLFLTTKCPGPTGFYATVQCAEDNLQMLGLYGTGTNGYIDLLLVHFPFVIKPECMGVVDSDECAKSPYLDPGTAARQETWRAMELLQKMGKVRAIGVSDYNATHLEETLAVATLPIALHQVEWNPYTHDDAMLALCQQRGIRLQAWSPLGGAKGSVLGEPTMVAVAKAHNVSTAQVALKWAVQRGVAVVTGTDNRAHMQSDLDLWRFNLTIAEVDVINNLKR